MGAEVPMSSEAKGIRERGKIKRLEVYVSLEEISEPARPVRSPEGHEVELAIYIGIGSGLCLNEQRPSESWCI